MGHGKSLAPPDGRNAFSIEHSRSDPNLPEILEEYLAGQLTAGTKRIYQRDIQDFFGGRVPTLEQLAHLSPRDLNLWRNRMWDNGRGHLEAATINRKLTALKTFYDYLVGMGVVPLNPAHSKVVRRIRVKAWQPQLGLLVEEFQALLKAALTDPDKDRGMRDHALMAMGYAGLLRREELARTTWGDLVQDSGRVLLRLPLTKGGANDFVPVEKPLLTILDRYFLQLGEGIWRAAWLIRHPNSQWRSEYIAECPIFVALDNRCFGQGLSGAAVNEVVKRRATQARLMAGVHSHTLRHTGITHLLEQNVSLVKVQELARHSDPKITMKYFALLGRMKDAPTHILSANLV